MTNENSSPDAALLASVAKRLNRPIVLIGMMGVGKSTIARKLSALFDLAFADADEEIEAAAQMAVTEIFEKFGEDYFRDGEKRVIARLLDKPSGVIATGGGAFMQEGTRQTILKNGIAIWLDADVDTLVERVGRKDTRPLLRDGDPKEILTRLKDERDAFYALAPIHIVSHNGPHSHTVDHIIKGLDAWL